MTQFTTWKTVTTTGKKIIVQRLEEKREKGFKVKHYAEWPLTEIKFSKKKQEIELVKVTVNDLFSDNEAHTTKDIYFKANELGLEFCPPELGSLLKLALVDEPLRGGLAVGIDLNIDFNGWIPSFHIYRHPDGLYLHSSRANLNDYWNPTDEFVFRLPKSVKKKS